ncbi:MAG TPA: cyclic dehypoxanthinyl futalosine synthase [Ktedonobacterales bacterium]|nr:cyclic dehypoxanthinyl futalosine synthase [Ktedonobacterales bacterium]
MPTITTTEELLAKAVAGERLALDEGLRIFADAPDDELRAAADSVRRQRHPEGIVTYLVDRNINYTNVCIIDCGFCAFYRKPASPEGYLLSNEEIGHKIEQLLAWGGTRILLQGGVHPYLKLDYYTDLLRYIKQHYPTIQIDAFSPVEVWNIARIMKMPLPDVLAALKDAGLDGLPGGGAEILDNRTRNTIAPHKGTWESWIEAERQAQRLGLTTSATMVFGFGEELEERLLHLSRVRELQDESLAYNGNGFTSFICWSYQPDHTAMGGSRAPGQEYLRMVALARLMLDNVENVSASWPSQGPALAREALRWGANDFGSTMMEENVVSAAGADVGTCMTVEQIHEQIRAAGFRPAKRDSNYRILELFA